MSKLKRKYFPKPPTQYPSFETMKHIWDVLGWVYLDTHHGAILKTPEGYGYAIMQQEYKPTHHEAWETFLDVKDLYEKTSLVT